MNYEKKYINRLIDNELTNWASSDNRKPLLLRGARQVGKSSSIRKLGEKFEFFVEINFEKDKDVRNLFELDNPKRQKKLPKTYKKQ
jgi:predicted AAA+ superfamily ATPase